MGLIIPKLFLLPLPIWSTGKTYFGRALSSGKANMKVKKISFEKIGNKANTLIKSYL